MIGAPDPKAPKLKTQGYDIRRPVGHPIHAVMEFDMFTIFSLQAVAGGYPKRTQNEKIRRFTARAVESFCDKQTKTRKV